MRPTSSFLTKLNEEYAEPVVPIGERLVNFWDAIDHVLIAGTTPPYFTLYLGYWQQLLPHLCWRTIKVGPFKTSVPYPAFKWNWIWEPLLDVLGSLTPYIPELADAPQFIEGQGDSVVEKTSAHAQGIAGKIRRTEFKLQHFAIKANREQYTHHQAPSGDATVVNPFGLLSWSWVFPSFKLETVLLPKANARALTSKGRISPSAPGSRQAHVVEP
jgi:hypothetical protein